MSAISPAASGPAGPQFEAQVAAYYLLALLSGGQPRGLPGTAIDRIALQRASEGHPLDDVIVHAQDGRGVRQTLAIQVKRSLTFAPSDADFRAVVAQIAETTRQADFWAGPNELAVAIARTTQKIETSYQEVLAWARRIGSAETFFERIARRGSANDDMRRFLQTFTRHLKDAGASADDEGVWKLLARFQILTFDFAAIGSATLDLVKERATAALSPEQASQADSLWSNLIEITIETAARGGDTNRDRLVDELHRRSFRLPGRRSFSAARAALAEDSRHALNDIRDRVGDVILTRHARIQAVRNAMELGRYVEIRGEAGVGKSAVLKELAEQIAKESQIIVLSPDRITPRGWRHLAAALQFSGSARDLLSDLAADGSAILFIDSIERFDDEEQKTAADLVTEVSSIPGFSVVVTARRGFAVEDESWLPASALDDLVRAPPVLIDELSDSEVAELAAAAPGLAQLLNDNHPAKAVTRNLYRLNRLLTRGSADPVPRSEIDMVEQWWRTADGANDDGQRDRARVLRFLAEEALDRKQPLSTTGQPSAAVTALIRSGTLRDLDNDRVTFTHDVLREWAVAMLLHLQADQVSRLILEKLAPVSPARSLELAARMALERGTDGQQWKSLLESVSGPTSHGSWRRAVILASVRSEVAFVVLSRLENVLFENKAALLREVIRTVMAVEVESAEVTWAQSGIDRATIPAGLKVPSGLAWCHLLLWLQQVGERVPAAAIPDLADLYGAWCMGLLGTDALTPALMGWIYRWLTEIESPKANSFAAELGPGQAPALETSLRQTFVLFARRVPELAAQYLTSLAQRRTGDHVVLSVLKLRGTLAQAAPSELANLTLSALIPAPEPRRRRRSRDDSMIDGPFAFIDNQFLPASPSQGPFYELLAASPAQGLAVVLQLAQHAVSYYSDGKPHGDDAIGIQFSAGERTFPWRLSYTWSREEAHHASLSSALLALEAWSHKRIEAGEKFDVVLADVLGADERPAAYLLVAVDLIISHWPASREAALPFFGCPELLCLDRRRAVLENAKFPDIFGIDHLLKEPVGAVMLESLKKRPSRHRLLDSLLGDFAVGESTDIRGALTERLQAAVTRLGAPSVYSNLADPAFMALHALNLTNPANWKPVLVPLRDGTSAEAFEYVAPDEEREHLRPLQEAALERQTDSSFEETLGQLVDDPSRSSPDIASRGIAWAREKSKSLPDDSIGRRMRVQAILAAAVVAGRDGTPSLRADHAEWIRETLTSALSSEEDPGGTLRRGLRFNPLAMVFAGFVYLMRENVSPDDLRQLLKLSARGDAAVGRGLTATAKQLAAIDARLPRAVLRCAFAGCVWRVRDWDAEDGEETVATDHEQRLSRATDAEMAWLEAKSPEPDWPRFPDRAVRERRGLRIPSAWGNEVRIQRSDPPTERVNSQGAALWLRAASVLGVEAAPWLGDAVRTYWDWTLRANGAGLPTDTDVDNPPREWNEAFFEVLAMYLDGKALVAEAAPAICSLPDEAFFDALVTFLRATDTVYFATKRLDDDAWSTVRTVLSERMMTSRGWRCMRGTHSNGIEIHLGPAVATLFFNDYSSFAGPARCYLHPPGIDRIDSVLPTLQALVNRCPSPFVAVVLLNLLEVSPRPSHLSLAVSAMAAWLEAYPDEPVFWVSSDFGLRICRVIDRASQSDRAAIDPATRTQLEALLPALVRIGISEAALLETILSQ